MHVHLMFHVGLIIFKFLFKDKGKTCPHKFGKFYTFEDLIALFS